MKKLIVSFLVLGLVVAVGSERKASAESLLEPSTPIALSSTIDCQNVCKDCQSDCKDKGAGSARDRCKEACTTSAEGCCSVKGAKAPNYLSCTCN